MTTTRNRTTLRQAAAAGTLAACLAVGTACGTHDNTPATNTDSAAQGAAIGAIAGVTTGSSAAAAAGAVAGAIIGAAQPCIDGTTKYATLRGLKRLSGGTTGNPNAAPGEVLVHLHAPETATGKYVAAGLTQAGIPGLRYTIYQQVYRTPDGGVRHMEDRGDDTQNHTRHITVACGPAGN